MRTQLLGGVALLLGAVAFLCGAGAARAQGWSGYGGYGYPAGYGQGYQAAAPASYRYPANAGGQSAGASPYYYYPGYGYYPNYAYYYPNYGWGRQGCQYPQGYQAPQGNQTPHDAAQQQGVAAALPGFPLGPDEIPTDEAPPLPPDAAAAAPAHHDRFWASADYNMTFIKPWRLTTPLVTTGSLADAHPGALGQPGTAILFGDRVDFGNFDGVRLATGLYLDDGGHLSLELAGQYQLPNHEKFALASDAGGNPIITRPVFDPVAGTERAYLTAFPGIAAGGITVDARSQFLGAELNGRYGCQPCEGLRLDALLGVRFLRLAESLTVRDQFAPLSDGALTFEGAGISPPDTLADVDSFKTVNHFYGLQLGGSVRWEGKWVYAEAFGKAGLGVTDEEVDINGSTTLFDVTGPHGAGGGVLALPSNIGQHTRTALGFVPEGGVNFGVRVTPWLRLTAGYSFLYWNSVVRPGAQIDRVVTPTMVPTDVTFGQLAGPLRPAFRFNDESFWVHSLLFGVDFHY